MGVMKCDRVSCGNLLCDTYTDVGFVCSDCKSEFEDLMEEMAGNIPASSIDVREEFKIFMSTEKNEYRNAPEIDPLNIDWDLLNKTNFN